MHDSNIPTVKLYINKIKKDVIPAVKTIDRSLQELAYVYDPAQVQVLANKFFEFKIALQDLVQKVEDQHK